MLPLHKEIFPFSSSVRDLLIVASETILFFLQETIEPRALFLFQSIDEVILCIVIKLNHTGIHGLLGSVGPVSIGVHLIRRLFTVVRLYLVGLFNHFQSGWAYFDWFGFHKPYGLDIYRNPLKLNPIGQH